jgi:muramidase (phage lysozyme)
MPSRLEYISYLQLPQVRAALDTIAWAEGGRSYNTLYGGGSFTGSQHPNRKITAGGYTSTAAGRYQFLHRTWIEIKNRLGLPDFTAVNQDIAALDLINQRGQLGKLLNGDFEGMMRGLGCAWAALPFSGCGQPQRSLTATMNYFRGRLGQNPIQIAGPIMPRDNPINALSMIGIVLILWVISRPR